MWSRKEPRGRRRGAVVVFSCCEGGACLRIHANDRFPRASVGEAARALAPEERVTVSGSVCLGSRYADQSGRGGGGSGDWGTSARRLSRCIFVFMLQTALYQNSAPAQGPKVSEVVLSHD